ncbi:MAG: excinuclease ABC subunit UvrA [Nitrospirae bacterium]|nr:excinuclease ABC subunit UvrA [Nitrospirota bacterium]
MRFTNWLEIKGIKQNNLKNIDIKMPHDCVIAVTGVSGSGKSSLAFDTIFAEGQWRFIESLSSYARLFIEKLDRPDVEEVKNIRPAIALKQRNPIKSSRSTVGTLTEIYDLFRILYSKVSEPKCPKCGKPIKRYDISSVYQELISDYLNKRAIILFESTEPLSSLQSRGFYRILRDSSQTNLKEVIDIVDIIKDDIENNHQVIVDRIVIHDEGRLSDSLELAWREGGGRLIIMIIEESVQVPIVFSDNAMCQQCGLSLPAPAPILFSFNHPVGACPECKGFGNILILDESLIIPNNTLTLSEGAIEPWEKPAFTWFKEQLMANASKNGVDVKKAISEFSEDEIKVLFKGGKGFYGINDFFEILNDKRYKFHIRIFINRYKIPQICPKCLGKRLKSEVLSYKIDRFDIGEISGLTITELIKFFESPPLSPHYLHVAKEAIKNIRYKLEFLERVGLGYLTLDRQALTLSGGEYQRVNLSNQLGAKLAGTLYILDEPTVGLHSSDNKKVIEIIKELAALGNTIIVVEHDPELIRAADWVVELGLGGGLKGGEVIFNGEINEFLSSDTITAKYLSGALNVQNIFYNMMNKLAKTKTITNNTLNLIGAKGHNLKNISIEIPLNSLTVVSGVSGSGKSTLIVDTLYRIISGHFGHFDNRPLEFDGIEGIEFLNGVSLVDQSPIGKSPRSNPATYLKIFDLIRRIFASLPEARIFGYDPGFFSFNVEGGRCPKCQGEGFERLEMYFFEDLFIKCDRCDGSRYSKEALKVRFKGYSISDVLDMTVDKALEVFNGHGNICKRLELLKDVGLDYIKLGQPATTLSGGEAQRIKICAELGITKKKDFLYIMDEPTIGLHLHDISQLLYVLRRLVDLGNTVVVIEHNLDFITAADHVIDIGVGAGVNGGNLIYSGSPHGLKNCAESLTAKSIIEAAEHF